ncbi:MAG: aminotransferase class I/II-fold pyridoxal phosphate-dependent enzyme [Paludibacteraceae bacterium]|nr:aminotransferase class I/II-fold pyridoxal phosphate-dependent enzyme [Paludibacteraceae bacterium]
MEKIKRIHLCLAHMSEAGWEEKFVKEAFDTNWVVPLGPNVDAFEADLERFLGEGKSVAALSSGTAAVHLSMVLLDVQPGDEVICQSFTFAASCNPIVYQGATPVFVDSEPDTWNMDPDLLEVAIKDRLSRTGRLPKAIVLVSLYGMPPKCDEILAVADRYGIPVVEDAAEAFGSKYKGRSCGTFGRFGVLSFNGNKMITTSGGGALVCPDEAAKRKALFYATQAREPFPYYQHEQIGYNYRMSNVCAGIGRGQMYVAEDHIRHHRLLAEQYVRLFAGVDKVSVHLNPSAVFDSNYWLNTITFDGLSAGEIERIRLLLDDAGVESRPLWKPLHLQPVFKDAPRYLNGVSEGLFASGLCLPSGPCVSVEDAGFVADMIKSAL